MGLSGYDIDPLTGVPGSRTRRRQRQRRLARLLHAASSQLEGTLLGSWLHGRLRRQLDLRTIDLCVAGDSTLDGLSIAFISDLHAGHFMTAVDIEAIFSAVARLEPDLICLGGDMISMHQRELELFEAALRCLTPTLGVFAVPGNHEYYHGSGLRAWLELLQRHGVTVLLNSGTRIVRGSSSLWLAGVDDLSEGEPDLSMALAGRRPDEFTVLLSHNPDMFVAASQHDVDLTLSGHTHGGQVRLLGWTPLRHSRFGYYDGLYRRDRSQLYVGRGVGVTALPFRIGVRAELPLIRLTASDGAAAAHR